MYTRVEPNKFIEYTIEDLPAQTGGRKVSVHFIGVEEGIKITETFDAEHENPEEVQRLGWQAILDNFKKHVEAS